MARQMTRSELVRSWSFFVAQWALLGTYLLLNGRYASLGKIADLCFVALLFWRLFGKTPDITMLQLWLYVAAGIIATGYGCRTMWDSLAVIPLMPVFALLCLFAIWLVVHQMVQMVRWMSVRFGKRVSD